MPSSESKRPQPASNTKAKTITTQSLILRTIISSPSKCVISLEILPSCLRHNCVAKRQPRQQGYCCCKSRDAVWQSISNHLLYVSYLTTLPELPSSWKTTEVVERVHPRKIIIIGGPYYLQPEVIRFDQTLTRMTDPRTVIVCSK